MRREPTNSLRGNIEEGGYMEMETVQIKGIDSTNRVIKGKNLTRMPRL